eukprot:723687-Hanusia_phi.AAC.1
MGSVAYWTIDKGCGKCSFTTSVSDDPANLFLSFPALSPFLLILLLALFLVSLPLPSALSLSLTLLSGQKFLSSQPMLGYSREQ